MTGTEAVPARVMQAANPNSVSSGAPLCPACQEGYLWPFRVHIWLGDPGFGGATALDGWVAVCQGNGEYLLHLDRLCEVAGQEPDTARTEPCGFSMPLSQCVLAPVPPAAAVAAA